MTPFSIKHSMHPMLVMIGLYLISRSVFKPNVVAFWLKWKLKAFPIWLIPLSMHRVRDGCPIQYEALLRIMYGPFQPIQRLKHLLLNGCTFPLVPMMRFHPFASVSKSTDSTQHPASSKLQERAMQPFNRHQVLSVPKVNAQ